MGNRRKLAKLRYLLLFPEQLALPSPVVLKPELKMKQIDATYTPSIETWPWLFEGNAN